MPEIFDKIKEIWEERGYEIIVGIIIIIIIILSLCRFGKKGSWSPKSHLKYMADGYKHIDSNISYKKQSSDSLSKNRPPQESTGEKECRRVLESIFRVPFKKSRPGFLSNPVTGGSHNLELDMFCPELKLACEYQGEQHYRYIPFFHKNKEAFLNQKYRDDLKKRLCRDNGVNLIEVPHTVKKDEIEEFIIKGLKYMGYRV